MSADPLSDVLSILKPRSYIAGGFDLGGAWSIQFNAHSGIKCYALMSGACFLDVEGVAEAVPLEGGDCVLLPNGRRFRITNNLRLAPASLEDLRLEDWHGGIATLNGGGDAMLLGGHFAFDGAQADMLMAAMPPVVLLRRDVEKAEMRWALERMRQELTERQPGSALVAQHLAHMLLVQALRLYIADGVGREVGWLFALADRQLAAAINAVHADPGRSWTLPDLAKQAGMSRSDFAKKFKATVGSPPIEYMTRWRMLLAGERLRDCLVSVTQIATTLGYASEAAFSTAFKRVMGCSPRRYGRDCSQRQTTGAA